MAQSTGQWRSVRKQSGSGEVIEQMLLCPVVSCLVSSRAGDGMGWDVDHFRSRLWRKGTGGLTDLARTPLEGTSTLNEEVPLVFPGIQA